MAKKKKRNHVFLCEIVELKGHNFFRVIYFPSQNLDNYLIPCEKFDPDAPESVYKNYIVGLDIISYLV